MQITLNRELRAKFDAGLTICGENFEGQLEWIGKDKEWRQSVILQKEAEYKQRELNKDWRDYEIN